MVHSRLPHKAAESADVFAGDLRRQAALRPPRALRRNSGLGFGGGPSLRLAPLRSVPAAGSLACASRFSAAQNAVWLIEVYQSALPRSVRAAGSSASTSCFPAARTQYCDQPHGGVFSRAPRAEQTTPVRGCSERRLVPLRAYKYAVYVQLWCPMRQTTTKDQTTEGAHLRRGSCPLSRRCWPSAGSAAG